MSASKGAINKNGNSRSPHNRIRTKLSPACGFHAGMANEDLSADDTDGIEHDIPDQVKKSRNDRVPSGAESDRRPVLIVTIAPIATSRRKPLASHFATISHSRRYRYLECGRAHLVRQDTAVPFIDPPAGLLDAAINETFRPVENDFLQRQTNQSLGHIVNFDAPISAFGIFGAIEQ